LSLRPPPLTHYVVVRQDLPRGFLAAQVVHAAGESAGGTIPDGTYAVVLAARDEDQLLEVHEDLKAAGGIPHVLIQEPDPPWLGQATAIGVRPTRNRRRVASVLGRLPLLK
jgi:peptidyl-tRNA hydrolase